MTRQMADDEVLRVLKRAIVLAEVHALVVHADELNGVKFYVAALQAERDALRKEVGEVREAYQARTRDWYSQGDAIDAAEQRAERAESERDALRDDVKLLTHKVITCGVAAANPDPKLSSSGPYGGEWDSPQAQDVRALRSRAERAESALEALRGQLAELVAAADAITFDTYALTAPETRAAFDGRESIAVVRIDTLDAFRTELRTIKERMG